MSILFSLSDGTEHNFCISQVQLGHHLPMTSVELALKARLPLTRPSVSDICCHFASSSSTSPLHRFLYSGACRFVVSSPVLASFLSLVLFEMMRVYARHCRPSSPLHAIPCFLKRAHHLQSGPFCFRCVLGEAWRDRRRSCFPNLALHTARRWWS